MLIAFVALAAGRRGSEAFAIVVAWFAGYSLTWASKWAIACVAGVKWSDIFEVIVYRMNGDAPGFVRHHFLAPTGKVLSYLFHQKQSPMLFLLLLPTLLLPVRWPDPRRFILLSSPILIPFMWFELLSNHTQIYDWITYRPLASCFGILSRPPSSRRAEPRRRWPVSPRVASASRRVFRNNRVRADLCLLAPC